MEKYIILSCIGVLIIYGLILYKNRWKKFDPSRLLILAEEQYPNDFQLHAAIKKSIKIKNDHFVNPLNANQPGSEWQFEQSVTLIHPEMGEIMLDILKDGRVGSIEYFGLIMNE